MNLDQFPKVGKIFIAYRYAKEVNLPIEVVFQNVLKYQLSAETELKDNVIYFRLPNFDYTFFTEIKKADSGMGMYIELKLLFIIYQLELPIMPN